MARHYIIPIFVPHAGCPHLCVFCNQKRISGQGQLPDTNSVSKTIATYMATMPPTGYREVAFYGGSFTALPLATQRELLLPATKAKADGSIQGIRLSTRPDAISLPIIAQLKELGVDTVELGVQSMDAGVLLASKRGHSAADVESATAQLKQAGFQVGHQLMPGLPGDSPATALASGKAVARLYPDFVRIYPTLVIKNTELEQSWSQGLYQPWSLEQAIDVCAQLVLLFESRGIKIIRLGLQPSDELREEGTVVAGPFHSAFGELVENRIARWQMETLLQPQALVLVGKAVVVHVNHKYLSKFIGQKQVNRLYIQNKFKLASFKILADAELAEGTCNWRLDDGSTPVDAIRRSDLYTINPA